MHDLHGVADYEALAQQHTPRKRVLALFRPNLATVRITTGIARATAPFIMQGAIGGALPARDVTIGCTMSREFRPSP